MVMIIVCSKGRSRWLMALYRVSFFTIEQSLTIKFSDAHEPICRKCILQINHYIETSWITTHSKGVTLVQQVTQP